MKVTMALKMVMPVIISNTIPTPDTIRMVSRDGNRMVKERATLLGTLSGILISIFPLLTRRQ